MHIIVKTTNLCNLHCEYCYHRYFCRVKKERLDQTLSIPQARVIFRKVCEWALYEEIPVLKFIWHGGEPLLLPKEFYTSVINEQAKLLKGVPYTNSIQSNLSVPLGDDYIRFLVASGFGVGMSFDVINTARDPNGVHKPAILRNLFRFSRYGRGLGAIAVVSKYNVDYPHLLFDFFSSYVRRAHFNRAWSFLKSMRLLSITTDQYFDFMKEMFLMWKSKGFKGFCVGNVLDIAKRMVRPDQNSMCYFDEDCMFGRIHIAMNGDVYPCDNLVDRDDFIYGNIYDRSFSLKSIFAKDNPVFKIFERRRVRIMKECKGCEFLKYCYGGCPNDTMRSGASFHDKSDLCSYYKRMFKLIRPHAVRIVDSSGV